MVFQVSAQQLIWQNEKFRIYKDSVVQGNFVAKIVSPFEITSNYKSPIKTQISPYLSFKFSINGKDNEMKYGINHEFTVVSENGDCQTPLIKFGTQLKDATKVPENTFVKPGTELKIKLDMRDVIKDFNFKGFYITTNGDKLFKEDFKSIHIAGGTLPMLWDFDILQYHPELQLKDTDQDGIYELSLKIGEEKEDKALAPVWKLKKDIGAQPLYKSDYLISDAVYNMAIEEMLNAVEPDSTFRTGKEWAGVWTRDISYSIILSMAYLQPKVAMYSLLKKVKNGRIIQDTGTGGAYPASTDRMIWANAAWEVYKATGDKQWLLKVYEIIKNSIIDDSKNVYDAATGLVKGESSFLDWREQTYPKWMQPADIFESACLGTNAAHFQANIVAAEMAELLGETNNANIFKQQAQKIKEGINKYLWLPEKGYYAQFIYGRNNKIASPRAEALGEALVVYFGIADAEKQQTLLQKTPQTNYGITCIYPQIPGIPPYHNNAVWPFVESYWALAAAKAANEASLLKSIASIYRPATLFLTNKENFVSTNGDYAGTVINSSNMLWSLSGNIALVHKILFGIEFQADRLSFHPFVPEALKGKRSLNNFKYRDAILNIEMEGFGNKMVEFLVDGVASNPIIGSNLTGIHSIKIKLDKGDVKSTSINLAPDVFSPETPIVVLKGNRLVWNQIVGANSYTILSNGKATIKIQTNNSVVDLTKSAEYQVIATDVKGIESFASEPILVYAAKSKKILEAENLAPKSSLNYKGFLGLGFVEISKSKNLTLNFALIIDEEGTYAIDFRYANGNGPTNTENKCAIRTLKKGNDIIGTVVFPQRGKDEWSNWGFSNSIQSKFSKGKHNLSLTFETWNENMNGEINEAMLDQIRIIKLEK